MTHLDSRYKLTGLLLFSLFTLICYWSIPSLAYQEWDSIENVYVVETFPFPLEWGNHPLVHIIQSLIYRMVNLLGYSGSVLNLLQLINVVATGASVAMLYVILSRRFNLSLIQSAGWAAFLGSAYSVISFAGTAEIYSIALLLLLLAWNSLLLSYSDAKPRRLIMAGVLIGLAGLAHQFSAILLGASSLVGVLNQTRQSIAILWVAVITTLLLGYGMLGYFAVGALSISDIYDWVRGYIGDTSYGRYLSLEGIQLAIYSSTTSLIRGADTYLEPLRVSVLFLISGIFILLVVQFRSLAAPTLFSFAYPTLPVLVGLPFIIWWDPGLVGKWWILIAPFFIVAFSFAIRKHVYWKQFAPICLAMVVLLVNQLGGLRYEHKPDRVFEQALQTWSENTSREDVLYESNVLTEYLLYMYDRPNTISVFSVLSENRSSNDPYRAFEIIFEKAWERGARVYYTAGLNEYYDERLDEMGVSKQGLDKFFRTYRWDGPVFEYRERANGPVKQVYRLLPADTDKTE